MWDSLKVRKSGVEAGSVAACCLGCLEKIGQDPVQLMHSSFSDGRGARPYDKKITTDKVDVAVTDLGKGVQQNHF